MKHLGTSIPGLVVIALAVLLFLYGDGKEQTLAICGTLVTVGIGFLKAADASKTVQKDELPGLGPTGRALGREVVAAEKAEEKKASD